MDDYTDEQCAQLLEFRQFFIHKIAGVDPMDAMVHIQNALKLVGDNELIVHFLAGEYGAQAFQCKVEYGTGGLSFGIFEAFWEHVYDPWDDDDYKHDVWLTCVDAYRQAEDYWEQEQEPQRGYSVRGYDWEVLR